MISPMHGCLFVHVPKTAGQSVETALLADAGKAWSEGGPLVCGRNRDPRRGPPRLAHLTLDGYLDHGHVGPEDYARLYKFAFVRNPWARAVSLYKSLPYRAPFRTFVADLLGRVLWETQYWFVRPQTDYVLPRQGRSGLDFLGRYEDLQGDFEKVRERLGVKARLPGVNRSASVDHAAVLPMILLGAPENGWRCTLAALRYACRRKEGHASYRDYYTAETRARVARLYASDIEAFGYEF